MAEFDFDAAVVGAGAVGLGTGYALARRGLSVVVLEAQHGIGQGVSSRNSEVIHGGLYYETGSYRARLSVAGRRLLYAFLDAHGVAYDRCGKLVVATEPHEIPVIEAVAKQAVINGVEGIQELTGAQARALEPELRAVGAILSPQSGVFDSHAYMLALQGEIEGHGGAVALGSPLESAAPLASGGFRLRTGGDDPAELTVRLLATAPGLSAQAVAASIEGFPAGLIPKAYFGKGSYVTIHGKAPFGRLVYPVPAPGTQGRHYRRDIGGQARFGPDLEFVEAPDYQVRPERVEMFYGAIRRYWPGLPDGALVADYAGVRPKLHGPDQPQPDWRIDGPEKHGMAGLVTLFGIESPGLTSSLAIGEEVATRLGVNPAP